MLRMILPILSRLRCVLDGFNIGTERGAHALLAAALSEPYAGLRGDLKYVMRAGLLVPGRDHTSCGGKWSLKDQDRMLSLCEEWEELWRKKVSH